MYSTFFIASPIVAGRPPRRSVFGQTVCKTVRQSPYAIGPLSCLSVCDRVTLVYCGQTAGRIKMKVGMQIGLGPGHIVLDEDRAPLSPKGHSPSQFSAHICCGQMVVSIKMLLGMKLGLSPGDFVLDGDPTLPSLKRGQSPPPQSFGPCLLRPNDWMDEAAWYLAWR